MVHVYTMYYVHVDNPYILLKIIIVCQLASLWYPVPTTLNGEGEGEGKGREREGGRDRWKREEEGEGEGEGKGRGERDGGRERGRRGK